MGNEVDSLSSSNGIGHLTHQRHHHLSIEKEEGNPLFWSSQQTTKIRDPLMTYVSKIISQMTGIFKPQQKASFALLSAQMCFSGRARMPNLYRYGAGSAKRLRRGATKGFDFYRLNEHLLSDTPALSVDQDDPQRPQQAILIDSTFTNKSGKHTEGLGFFHNGCSASNNKMERGLEFTLFAGLNLDEQRAYAIAVTQTKNDKSALKVAIDELTTNSEYYLEISKYVVADGYYAKNSFISEVTQHGFEVVTLLRRDAALRYLYTGPYSGRGRPKRYADRVNYKELNDWERDEELIDDLTIYSKIVNYKVWKRDLRVLVIVNRSGAHRILCSTDLTLSTAEILKLYQQRFKIEFLFRDGKQHTGLGHAQTLDSEGQEYFANASFTTLNMLRLEEREQAISRGESPLGQVSSIRSLKVRKHNELILDLFISMLGESREHEKVKEAYEMVSKVGVVAA